MKNILINKYLVISALLMLSMSLFAQTEGKKVKIYASSANSNDMLAPKEDITFKQDFETENLLINIYPEFKYQQVLGFGAAFTETSAVNFSLLSPDLQQKLIDLYFGKDGLGLNFCRTHINAADYSVDAYTYVKDGDVDLKTFSIDRERKDILPMIKMARKANPDLWLFASPWSPPAWMKDNNSMIHGGRLLPQYYKTWAKYFALYLNEYKKEGIDFFGVTIQNEAKAVQTWESCIWSAKEEGEFAVNYLRPTLDENGFDNIKIMIWDHNKERVVERARESLSVPGAEKAIWGIAHHWYSGDHFDNLRMTHELFPDKPLIATENSNGGSVIGSPNWWNVVERFAKETIMDFNNFTSAEVAWNLIVDQTGGPVNNRSLGAAAPVVVDTDKKDYSLRSTFYTIEHFSKFIKRGAVRIGSSSYNDAVKVAAFSNPNGEIVVVILNTSDRDATPKIRMDNCTAEFNLPAKSLQTMVIPNAAPLFMLPPNTPQGEAKGIFPGRVAWVYAPNTVNWDETTGFWFEDRWNKQDNCDQMIKQSLFTLTGKNKEKEAWTALFSYFNKNRGKKNLSYQPNEKIAIKINQNNTYSHENSEELNASPQLTLSLLRSLIKVAGVPQDQITVFDASRYITDYLYNKCASEFPRVKFVDNSGGDGRIQSTYVSDAIHYSTNNGKLANGLATCLEEADYVINMALLKGHVGQGVTLCAKNWYGTTDINADWRKNFHDNFNQDRTGKAKYMTFVDFMGHKDTGGKTLIYFIDGLYGSQNVAGKPSGKWDLTPFNGNWPNSLFASQDPVAIDAVGLDFLSSEWPGMVDINYADMYLLEAAMANNPPSGTVYDPGKTGTRLKSLGVLEHWNNSNDKKYSRNLGKNGGIELVFKKM